MKCTVTATLTKTYEIEIEMADPADAIALLDGWEAEDFEQYETGAKWEMVAI